MTTNDLDQAREWAKDVHPGHHPEAVATAKVINSLPDEWIDADKVREVIGEMRENIATAQDTRFDNIYCKATDWWAEQLEALLPTPQPRTLADIPWDDDEHPYMEAVTVSGRRYIILAPMGNTAVSDNTILAAERGGGLPVLVPAECLTPLPDLPRMVWPDQPRPEDAPVKEPWLVEFRGERYIGARDQYDAPNWALARMDGTNIHFADDHEVTLVSRLVPEVKA